MNPRKGKVWYRKNGRIFKTHAYTSVVCESGYWWNGKRWVIEPTDSLHFHGCHSIKAFRRRLRQWSKYLPKGTIFILHGPCKGLEVLGVTRK